MKEHEIHVYPDTPNADTVDILIIIKDVWSIGFGAEISDINSGEFGIWNKSIFGFGHENQHNIFWDVNGDLQLGYEGIYKISNLAGKKVFKLP